MSQSPADMPMRFNQSSGGGWHPKDPAVVAGWIAWLRAEAATRNLAEAPPIAALRTLVTSVPYLNAQAEAMFADALKRCPTTPLGQPSVIDFNEFLLLLNVIMQMAPEAYQTYPALEPAGLIGFPINALLNWPMATEFGYTFFSDTMVNERFRAILIYWSRFLTSAASTYVLTETPRKVSPTTIALPWLGAQAQSEMVAVAQQALGDGPNPTPASFAQIFNCDPSQPSYGFGSWDEFFTRTFKAGVRPISAPSDDSVIVNACESAPLQVVTNAQAHDQFWLKGQPYSLADMMANDPFAPQFTGGTVYQAFLSALSFHRWHSPVSGTLVRSFVAPGSYYLENLYQGFVNPAGADPSAPNQSQPFLSSVATRAVMFIQADNPKIGLMCVVAIGMAEVSSCEVTVKPGQHINKGDQIGMFHFGGSTHCLVFRPGVNLNFDFYGQQPNINATNMRVNTRIAVVS
ncbi:phophatidylserine decarboxylase associated domain-containing protein [Rhizobium sp. G187]|uniref:phophatidylserine decarboxylase associated domain-containing protein n=1 Tax=Rhizobium sp. G187 TaxID=3451352 RepID=UPI003EE812A8